MTELTEKIRAEMIRVLDGFRDQSVYWAQRDDAGMVDMIESDINYNQSLLNAFLENGDLKALYKDIYHQDTAPREEFFRVLDWIDDHLEA